MEQASVERGREATLRGMDRVRFGRALGFGARAAMKTLVTAVDAATTANPSDKGSNAGANGGQTPQLRRATDVATQATTGAAQSAGAATARTAPDTAAKRAVSTAARTVTQARGVEQGLRRESRRFGEAMWGPFVRLSGVLWLEVSGVFFGIFALLAVGYLWKLRGEWHLGAANAAGHRSLMGAVIMLALFGYFCVSNFVRARRRERRR